MSVKGIITALVNVIRNLWANFSFFVRISYHVFRYILISMIVRKPARSPPSTTLDLSDGRPMSSSTSTQGILMDAMNVANGLQMNGEQQSFKDLFLRFNALYDQQSTGRNNRIKSSFCDRVFNAERLVDWNNLDDGSKVQATNEYVSDIKKIIEVIASKFPVAKLLSGLTTHYESNSINDKDLVASLAVDGDKKTEKSHTSDVVAINKRPSVTDTTDMVGQRIQDVMESTVRNYLKTKGFNGDLGSGKRITITQKNWTGKNTQLKYLEEGLNEMRSTVSGMDLNLELLADRVTNLELKLNKMDEEIKNLVAK